METQVIALPQFAPLSVPMVLHLMGYSTDEFIARATQPIQGFVRELQMLEQQVIRARDDIFTRFQEEYELSRSISIKWFRATVPMLRTAHEEQEQEPIKSLSSESIANWRESNALKFVKWGKMDLDSASAVLIMALLDKRERHFLPSSTSIDEPVWWCYSQAPPTQSGLQAPIIPRAAVPLPEHLEPGTLLWSSWPSFNSEWTQFPGLGAIRFSSLTQEALGLWDPGFRTSEIGILLEGQKKHSPATAQALQRLGQSTLYKLAVGRIGVPVFPAHLLWDRNLLWPNRVVIS